MTMIVREHDIEPTKQQIVISTLGGSRIEVPSADKPLSAASGFGSRQEERKSRMNKILDS